MAKLKYKCFVTSLERADKKTGLVGKKLIVHLPISVTKWVWMASLTYTFNLAFWKGKSSEKIFVFFHLPSSASEDHIITDE